MLLLEALFMLPAMIIGFAGGDADSGFSFLMTAAGCAALGLAAILIKADMKRFYAKEGFVIVSLAWIILSIAGALPFYISGSIPSFVDAFFECVSGFTTTGASILTDVDSMPSAMLYWRSFTHWLGGMGVLVLILAITPMMHRNAGGSTLHILRAESPGPSVGKIVPKMRNTAQILYGIYILLTIIMAVILLITGMGLFDAVCVTFGTAGTGGFSNTAAGCAAYTPVQQWVITVFMILFGVNFSIYYLILIGDVKTALTDEETLTYFGTIIVAATLIALNISRMYTSVGDVVRDAFFQVGSVMTTTGFATTDFNLWPTFSKVILVILMFVGASAGSTGGGIKMARIMILVKSVSREIKRMIHPQAVRPVRISGKVVPDETVRGVNVYICAYFAIYAASMLIVSLDGFEFADTFTAVAATINNIGPGLGTVGPYGSYAGMSVLSKLVLTADMLIGRLEIYPILLLFAPSMWRRSR